MIDPELFSRDDHSSLLIRDMLQRVDGRPSLGDIWGLMDAAWKRHGCDNCNPSLEKLVSFYKDPVWLLNGFFIEQDNASMGHRLSIASYVRHLSPHSVVDYGGGFGTLARLIAACLPCTEVAILDPFPSRSAIERCAKYPNISFTPSFSDAKYDVLVSTDVLEHVIDPLLILYEMIDAVRLGGYLIIANCFYPVILCHLPATFHLRFTFDSFCQEMGLAVCGPCSGSHATVYQRVEAVSVDWVRIRALEKRSQWLFPLRSWRFSAIAPWELRLKTACLRPLYYPRKLYHILLDALSCFL